MIIAEDKKVLKNITANIKRIITKDIPKIADEEVQFFLGQAFITVDRFLSSATQEVKTKEKAKVDNG